MQYGMPMQSIACVLCYATNTLDMVGVLFRSDIARGEVVMMMR
jgi:hypothetical protein